MVSILAFPVHSVAVPIRLHRAGESFAPFQLPRYPPDWSSNDPVLLSESLNCQVKNNYVDFQQLSEMCQDPIHGLELWTGIYNELTDELSVLNNYFISQEQKEEQCHRFLERLNGYQDTLRRDQDVFNQRTWNVQTYAIVLLYKGEYYGHIYAWISPIKPPRCFAMGIRGRIDSVFRKGTLQNISAHLLEGVRRFAIAKECQDMTITKPLRIMEDILKKMGFQRKTIVEETVGRSLAFPRESTPLELGLCYSCFQHELSKSFTGESPIIFNLIE